MKLSIRDEWFKEIEDGLKWTEIRDAHITFVNEKNEKTLSKKVIGVCIKEKAGLPTHLQKSDMFNDDFQIYFIIRSLCNNCESLESQQVRTDP